MSETKDGMAPAVLSYFLVGILWWAIDEKVKKNAFVKFHVKQALVILIASIAVSVASFFLMFIPYLGWIAMLVLRLAIFVLWVMGIIKATQGKKEAVPILGQFINSFKF